MWSLKRSKALPIGLDIGYDSIKLLQLEVRSEPAHGEKDHPLAVIAAAREALSDEARKHPARRIELAAPQIKRMLARQAFVGRKVTATLPREIVHSRVLRLPPLPTDELDAALDAECRTAFPFEMRDARVKYLPAGEVRQGSEARHEVIVLAARQADVDLYLMQLEECGVTVGDIETDVTGLYRPFGNINQEAVDAFNTQMVIDIGARRCQVIIGRGKQICFCKPIEIGGLHLLDSISRRLSISIEEARALRHRLLEDDDNVDPVSGPRKDPVRQAVFDASRTVAQELGSELEKCLRYFRVTFRGRTSMRILLAGGEAPDSQLQNTIQASLGLPVEVANPFQDIDTSANAVS